MKLGQFKSKITINDKTIDSRLIILPLPPIDAKDKFLSEYYINSSNPNTVANMYNKWKHAVTSLLKKGRHQKITHDVNIIAHFITSTKRQLSPSELSSIYNLLYSDILIDKDQIISFCYKNYEIENTNLMMLNIFDSTEIDLKDLFLTKKDLKKLWNI